MVRDRELDQRAMDSYAKDQNPEKAPIGVRDRHDSRMLGALTRVWRNYGCDGYNRCLFGQEPLPYDPGAEVESAALHGVLTWLTVAPTYPRYTTPEQQRELRQLRRCLQDAAKKRLRQLERCQETQPTHSKDFTSFTWCGTNFQFSKGQQAEAVRVLFEAWEKGTPTLSEKTIGEEIGSSSNNFQLAKVFREKRKDGGYVSHPAWGTMIKRSRKGIYQFVEIRQENNPES